MPPPSAYDPLRVILADDHAFYRQGLAAILPEEGIDVVGQAADGLGALRIVQATSPAVAILDLNMPVLSGIEATRRLAETAPHTGVLILTISTEEAVVVEAIAAGARAYVLKDDPIEQVVAGIRSIAAGESLVSTRVASVLLGRIRRDVRAGPSEGRAGLSGRELEVLRLVAGGMGNDEIARALHISSHTVRNHVSSVLVKLAVNNRVQAAVQAVRGGLI